MKSVPYLNAVGALQYLATMTRPDIAYAVSYLGRFNCNPAPAHWLAMKHLFRYLIGTAHYKLIYRPENLFNVDSRVRGGESNGSHYESNGLELTVVYCEQV
jgi:hypothetical protein